MAQPEATQPAAVKDRSDRTAWLAVLEAVVIVLLRDKIAALSTEAERAEFSAAIKAEVDTVCDEIAALAPTTAYRGKLSPSAAKLAAARIKGGADYLAQEFLLALLPPAVVPASAHAAAPPAAAPPPNK
jgi:hypothetical protein